MASIASPCKFTLAAVALLTASSVAQAETTLRVPVVSRTIFYLPAWTAEKQGFFKQEGLDVKIEVYDASEKIFHDLRAGTHQIGIASIESVIAESYQGGKLKIVAGLAKRPPHFIIAQPEIKTLADLKGKTIGVVSMHEGTTFFIADIARAGGFKLEDVKVEAVGGSPTRARLLKERKIDMGLSPELRSRGRGVQQSGGDGEARSRLPVRLGHGRRGLGARQPGGARRLPQGAAARHRVHVRPSRRVG
jgi:ABC-type nitrate/sulfonate/bicarbonate transport system substrate-binding protein